MVSRVRAASASGPAVLGVTAATVHIPNGAIVTVDPSTGRVLVANSAHRH